MKNIFLIGLLFCIPCTLSAQDTLSITLKEVIWESKLRSVDAVVTRNEFKSSYWEYRTYKAELLPEVILSGTLPYYSKSYNTFQREDGSYTYVSENYSRMDATISVEQNVPWTGGKLSVESSTQRLQQYGDGGYIGYKSIPASITFQQPVMGFNRVKWLQKIEPVRYKEAKLSLVSQLEEISSTSIQYYFNLLIAQINVQIAEQNFRNTEKLYSIAEAKRKIGQLSENDLLQLRVSLLNAESYVTEANSNFKSRMFQLRSFLGYDEEIILVARLDDMLPENIPVLQYSEVLSLALANNSFTQNIQRRILEASRNLSQAKAERWSADIFVSAGMAGENTKFPRTFSNLQNDHIVQVGIKIPILDWGKGKGRVKTAEANKEVVASKIEKEKIDFKQNIFLYVENFNNQTHQVNIAHEADKVAQKRYETSVEAFILGKIDVLNLNDAQSSKDEARRNYIEQIYSLWSYYYIIRNLTLYDFASNREISVDFEEFIK